jgi:hypothetical protein
MAVVEADKVDTAGGGEVGDGRGGRTGDDERGVDLTVLQALWRTGTCPPLYLWTNRSG